MVICSGEILSPHQLKRLSEHKYSSSGCTLLDPIMQPFWSWLVNKFPLWLAPNLMTVTGMCINIFPIFILVFYSPDAKQLVPRWAFALCAIGLFIYQTLDACDGKQARRIGSSTPLGELFDHGCDSLSTVFIVIGVCIAVQLGSYPMWMFLQCFVAMTLFYCAHWQTYVSGKLQFGKIDVTEGQFIVISVHLISAIFGPSIWSTEVPSICIEVKLIPTLIGLIAASLAFYSYFTIILTGGIGKNGSTVAGTSILSPLLPIGLVVVAAFTIYQKSTIRIYKYHPCFYIILFGLVASKVTNRLVVAHMTKSEIDFLDSAFVAPGLLFLNQYFNTFVDEYILMWVCMVLAVVDYMYYCTIICRQISLYLQIPLFTIGKVNSFDDDDSSSNENQSVNSLLLHNVSNGMHWVSSTFHKNW